MKRCGWQLSIFNIDGSTLFRYILSLPHIDSQTRDLYHPPITARLTYRLLQNNAETIRQLLPTFSVLALLLAMCNIEPEEQSKMNVAIYVVSISVLKSDQLLVPRSPLAPITYVKHVLLLYLADCSARSLNLYVHEGLSRQSLLASHISRNVVSRSYLLLGPGNLYRRQPNPINRQTLTGVKSLHRPYALSDHMEYCLELSCYNFLMYLGCCSSKYSMS